ncbi:MAG: hypothetical protein OES09_08925 [Gammaproteobacteria bacterium]|nr:hypothetical protein [Gammaproteobacteria bacterium]
MITKLVSFIQTRPLVGRLIWLLFAVLFYKSGETFTVWLLEPEKIAGALQWVWVGLFPILVPAFFIVNRYLGCATGSCAQRQCRIGTDSPGH